MLGELLITVGAVALLFVAWQLWIGDEIIGAQKHAEAEQLSQSWDAAEPSEPPAGAEVPADDVPQTIPVRADAVHGEQFAVMSVPRFGDDWRFTIASGTTRTDILDEGFIGHYPDTVMPGAVGNTAYAAHRWTSGEPFDPIDRLVIGDAIVIETPEGWYTYRFRTLEYVQDTQVDVLNAVPQTELTGDGRYITLTSCAPKLNMLERIIAYGVFDEFTPRADGAPSALTEGVTT